MHSARRDKAFGLSVGAVCAALAALLGWRGRTTAGAILGVVAVLLLVPALTRPSLLRIPSAAWWRLAGWLGWINSRILLVLIFALVLWPVGLILRLLRVDLLMRLRRPSSTAWVDYPVRYRSGTHYNRMY